jgi:hypothetical protein
MKEEASESTGHPVPNQNITESAIDLARETLFGDITDFLWETLKNEKNPLPWGARPAVEQEAKVFEIESLVKAAINKAVHIMAADGRRVMVGTLVSITAKDGIKATVKFAQSDPLRHDLHDAVGDAVLLVVSGAAAFSGRDKPPSISPDQSEMFDEDDGEDDGPVMDKGRFGSEGPRGPKGSKPKKGK